MMCEVAQRFAGWLGLGPNIQAALEYVFARWDGRGFPGTAGEAIPLPMRLLHVGRDVSLFLSAAGPDEARAVVERRSGAAYDPALAELAVQNFADILAGLDEIRMWECALECEPSPPIFIAGDRIDAAFAAIAAITGLKSPWLREHPTGVAELAEAAAWRMGLPGDAVTLVRRAALAHDLGRVGVSNAIWEKPGPLGFGEWERVRLHPHFTERAFAQSSALAPIGLRGRLTLRAARRVRLPPRHPRAGARSSRSHPRRRRLLHGHARSAAVQAGARCPGGRGRVDT